MPHHNEATTIRRGVACVAAGLALLTASLVAVRAQQAPPAPAPRPMIPLAASSLTLNPDAYIGENVSMTASVEQVLSKTAFTVDQDRTKATGKDVLVIAPYLNGTLEPNSYLTIQGEVVRFDPAEITRKTRNYTLDLPADLIAKYQGRPAVLATAVVTAALVDIGKRVLPPPTPAEVAFDRVMKTVNATFTAMRGGLETPNADLLKQQTATLKTAFGEAEAFFKDRGTTDAIGWAQEAGKLAAAMEASAAGAKWDEVRTSYASLQPLCASCHAVHRERQDDGTFRVKGDR